MDTSSLIALTLACAPLVHPLTAQAIVSVESRLNPYAIGVVGGALARQPRSLDEALATVGQLQRSGWDFSAGLAQINRRNWPALGLTARSVFEPCANLAAMQTVLQDCYARALRQRPARIATGSGATAPSAQTALRQALSCYYSGNFWTGWREGYVQRVVAAARAAGAGPPASTVPTTATPATTPIRPIPPRALP